MAEKIKYSDIKPDPAIKKSDIVALGKNLEIVGDIIKKEVLSALVDGGVAILESAQPHVPIFKIGKSGSLIGGASMDDKGKFPFSKGDLRRSGKVVAYLGLRRRAIIAANGEEDGTVSVTGNISALPERFRKYLTISVQYTDWKAFWAENALRPYSDRTDGGGSPGDYFARTPDTGPFFLTNAWAKNKRNIVKTVEKRMRYIDQTLKKRVKYKRGLKKGNYSVDTVEITKG